MCLIVFVSLTIFVFLKYGEYSTIKQAIALNEERILNIGENVSNEKAIYETNKEGFKQTSEDISKKLSSVFPSTNGYTELTRQIDVLEEELNRINDPFEISNLDFQEPVQEENYSFLPLRMNIKSSSQNFQKFLHKLENSGSLNDSLRLMDISSIKLSFQDNAETDEKMINFSVLINAYFQ